MNIEYLLNLLKENNISRYKLCKLIGFSYGSLSDLISGRSAIPRLDTIIKIAQALDLNDHEFAELCGYKNDKQTWNMFHAQIGEKQKNCFFTNVIKTDNEEDKKSG